MSRIFTYLLLNVAAAVRVQQALGKERVVLSRTTENSHRIEVRTPCVEYAYISV